MRFPNEFARHKALDLIGDLMLSGKRILGHVIAVKPGHGPNTKMAAKLKTRIRPDALDGRRRCRSCRPARACSTSTRCCRSCRTATRS